MFTNWQQVEDWIKDYQFDRWIFSRMRMGDGEKFVKTIDSDYFADDMADKLAMTKKYLESNGGHFYGYGYKKATGSQGTVLCEVTVTDCQQQTAGVGAQPTDAQTIGQLRESITREIRAQIKAEQYEKEKADFEREKREFEAEKQTALGAIVHYFAPIGQIMMQKKMMPKVAGMDAEEPVRAQRIEIPENEAHERETPEELGEDPFTAEEADQIMELMVRFKAAEPNYLQLISRVVEMAESGDGTYTMAKGFLLK